MTDKELALYLKRLSSELRSVYDTIAQQMPDDALRRGRAKGKEHFSIQRQEDLWRESNPDVDVAHVPAPKNPLSDTASAQFTALEALDSFIDGLNEDIAILLGNKI